MTDQGAMFGYARRGEAARIRARFGQLLVDVGPVTTATQEFDVPSFDALVKLAGEHGAKVSRVADPVLGRDLYFVDDGGIRYRYRAAARPGATPRAVTV